MLILTDNIKYYTKEFIKLLKIIFLGLLIVFTIIIIKYKPMYEIRIGNKAIGFVQEKQINHVYYAQINNTVHKLLKLLIYQPQTL